MGPLGSNDYGVAQCASIALGDRDEQFKFVLSSRDYALNPVELDAVQFATTSLRGERPWASLEPDTLALRGYVFATDSGTMYYAPELDVLLSRSFANSHCFNIHKQNSRSAKLVGVDFTPLPGARHADIEGTFWLDAVSRELRTLEFTYANLRFTKGDTLAGGRVQFLRLATGEWIIPDWLIRAPVASRASGMTDILTRLRTTGQPSMRVYAPTKIRVKRGTLMDVLPLGPDSTRPIWSRAPGTLRVRVTSATESRADAPLAGAVVRLPESTSQAVTDTTGVGQIDGLVGGEYFVDVTTPWYEALLRAPERLVVTMANGEHIERQVRVASVDQVVQSVCGGKMSTFMGILSGNVTRDGVPEPDALVTIDYSGSNLPGENSSIKTVRAAPLQVLQGATQCAAARQGRDPGGRGAGGAHRHCARRTVRDDRAGDKDAQTALTTRVDSTAPAEHGCRRRSHSTCERPDHLDGELPLRAARGSSPSSRSRSSGCTT